MKAELPHSLERLRPADPRRLGPYRLVGRLGSGSMGVVFLAHSADGRPVAVKVIHPHLAEQDGFRRRFRREVDMARRVPSSYTAAVLDADADSQPPYLVVEYVPASDLTVRVSRHGLLAGAELHELAKGVAAALTAIHAADVMHRDLKPRNVLLASDGLRVIDFGIARALSVPSELTETGMRVGTPGYMAPEQLFGDHDEVGAAADVFAWAALVLYARTGRPPRTFDSGADLRLSPPARIPELALLADPLRGLVERALAVRPEERPSARELRDALMGGAPGPSGAGRPGSAVPRRRSTGAVAAKREPAVRRAPRPEPAGTGTGVRSRVLLCLGLAATLVGAAGVVAWTSRPDPGGLAAAETQRLRVRSTFNPRCLDGADRPGRAARLLTCDDSPEQMWAWQRDGALRLDTGCLDLAGKERRDGTPVVIVACDGTPSQQWRHQAAGDLVNGWTGLCVDVVDGDRGEGAAVQIWTCNDLPHQVWKLSA